MQIALKETAETEYWIKVLQMSEYIDEKNRGVFTYRLFGNKEAVNILNKDG